MVDRIAIVGTGPTGIYTFQNLINAGTAVSITLFEKGEEAGVGMPYSPEVASKAMLANIASIEIPPVLTSYLDWLEDQPTAFLTSFGLSEDDLDERQFTPRLMLGRYFRSQFLDLVDIARQSGTDVEVNEGVEVRDVITAPDGLYLDTDSEEMAGPFDRVVLATGHVFPEADEATRSYFPSPWSGLIDATIPAVSVGIMGTSLSSIDAAMAVANQHGRFRRKQGEVTFQTDATGLRITLMSWTGILPEADFYCPLPYEPLEIMTDTAIADLTRRGLSLDGLFELFAAEIAQADPSYASKIGLDDLTADTFADAYFKARLTNDPFRWARRNLEEVEENKAKKVTVFWRYAILRMHEKFEVAVAEFTQDERERFDAGLKKVFVDNYAAVPSESIRRLLALRDAEILDVLPLGDDYTLDVEEGRTRIKANGALHEFAVFIDARGQKALVSEDLPFPKLREALLAAGHSIPEVDADFGLRGVQGFEGRLSMAALPYLMHDRPFIQGITASAEIGAAIARGNRVGETMP